MSDNAMNRFKKMLDERGVKHVGINGATRFTSKDGCECRAYGLYDVTKLDVTMRDITPEQAIAATLVNDGAVELQAENTKLRELVRDVVLIAYCSGSKVLDMQVWGKNADHRTIDERMRALGIYREEL